MSSADDVLVFVVAVDASVAVDDDVFVVVVAAAVDVDVDVLVFVGPNVQLPVKTKGNRKKKFKSIN